MKKKKLKKKLERKEKAIFDLSDGLEIAEARVFELQVQLEGLAKKYDKAEEEILQLKKENEKLSNRNRILEGEERRRRLFDEVHG